MKLLFSHTFFMASPGGPAHFDMGLNLFPNCLDQPALHRTEWDEKRSQTLARFLSLAEWRAGFLRTDFLPYTTALEEVVSDTAEIGPEDRQKLMFLARALRIPWDDAKQLEEGPGHLVIDEARLKTARARLALEAHVAVHNC